MTKFGVAIRSYKINYYWDIIENIISIGVSQESSPWIVFNYHT